MSFSYVVVKGWRISWIIHDFHGVLLHLMAFFLIKFKGVGKLEEKGKRNEKLKFYVRNFRMKKYKKLFKLKLREFFEKKNLKNEKFF